MAQHTNSNQGTEGMPRISLSITPLHSPQDSSICTKPPLIDFAPQGSSWIHGLGNRLWTRLTRNDVESVGARRKCARFLRDLRTKTRVPIRLGCNSLRQGMSFFLAAGRKFPVSSCVQSRPLPITGRLSVPIVGETRRLHQLPWGKSR